MLKEFLGYEYEICITGYISNLYNNSNIIKNEGITIYNQTNHKGSFLSIDIITVDNYFAFIKSDEEYGHRTVIKIVLNKTDRDKILTLNQLGLSLDEAIYSLFIKDKKLEFY